MPHLLRDSVGKATAILPTGPFGRDRGEIVLEMLVRAATPEDLRSPTPKDLSATAQLLYRSRRQIRHHLPEDLFCDPAWDMLLALYCRLPDQGLLTLSGLSYSAEVPHTTGLRWIHALEHRGLVKRVPNPNDKRSSFVELTDLAAENMTAFLSRVWSQMNKPAR